MRVLWIDDQIKHAGMMLLANALERRIAEHYGDCDLICIDDFDGVTADEVSQYDIIIMDLLEPREARYQHSLKERMAGIVLAKAIRSQKINVPIIFLTVCSKERLLEANYQLGKYDAYLPKPSTMNQIFSEIIRVIARTVA